MKPTSSHGSARQRRRAKRLIDTATMHAIWTIRLHELYEIGEDTHTALLTMRGEVSLSLKQHPTRAQDIRLAWNSYIKTVTHSLS